MDEASLIACCSQGNGKAQRALYDAYADRMLPVCIRYLPHLPDAEDAMIGGFFKFFRGIKNFEYRGSGSIWAFLKRIMINECLMVIRADTALRILEENVLEEEGYSIDLLAGLHAKDILNHIAALPAGYRTVFNLYEIEGYTHREIAEALGISDGTSKSQLSKAKNLLRKTLKTAGNHVAG